MQLVTLPLNFFSNTLIRTSCAFGGATSTSSRENGLFASHSTAALHLITCKKSKGKGSDPCNEKVTTLRQILNICTCRIPAHIWGKLGKKNNQKPTPKSVSVSQFCVFFFFATTITSDFVHISVHYLLLIFFGGVFSSQNFTQLQAME